MVCRARCFALRLLGDERGQDLVEYALLTTAIGFAGIAAFDLILTAMGVTYGSWGTSMNGLWEPPAPIGGS